MTPTTSSPPLAAPVDASPYRDLNEHVAQSKAGTHLFDPGCYFCRAVAAPVTDAGLDVERLTTVLYDWMPDGADLSDPDHDGQGIHLTGGDLARFIFDRAAEYAALSRPEKETA